jgi:TRAP-type C4-dicarboxylate transport system permease small subunit
MERFQYALRVIAVVTATALFGMILGGTFGYVAALITPTFFAAVLPWKQIEPLGFATVLGAFGGTFCGGFLGAFAVMLQSVFEWRRRMTED